MSSTPLAKLLDSLPFDWRRNPTAQTPLTDIQWRADACGPGSILFFYRFDDDRSDDELFRRYLADSAFAVLVTNRMLDFFPALHGKGVYVTRPGEWPQVIGSFCDLLYPLPTNSSFIGITGTNGKTTTVKYLESILSAHGRRVLTVGTLGISLNREALIETGFTSPPQIDLRRILHEQRDRYDVVVMEASSHALDQGRLHALPFANAGWTNFSQDHLDYHRDEASYFAAKARILDLIQEGGRLYCSSPAVVERLLRSGSTGVPIELVQASTLLPAAIKEKPFLALGHNQENYSLAAALADTLLPARSCSTDRGYWRHLHPVDGRFECRIVGNRILVIDFAHTPAALESILTAIRRGFPGARIATLFGCGGDRDHGKRPLMGDAAARFSDYVILTSDNPRRENPQKIIDDVLLGMSKTYPEVVVERRSAIERLFDFLASRPGNETWVALLAGKGHERYIDANGEKRYYSDQDEVEANLRRLGWAK